MLFIVKGMYVYCDILDKNENVFNREFLSVFGYFDIVGYFFDRVSYYLEILIKWKILLRNYILFM